MLLTSDAILAFRLEIRLASSHFIGRRTLSSLIVLVSLAASLVFSLFTVSVGSPRATGCREVCLRVLVGRENGIQFKSQCFHPRMPVLRSAHVTEPSRVHYLGCPQGRIRSLVRMVNPVYIFSIQKKVVFQRVNRLAERPWMESPLVFLRPRKCSRGMIGRIAPCVSRRLRKATLESYSTKQRIHRNQL